MKKRFHMAVVVTVLAITGNAYAESLNVTSSEVNIANGTADAHLTLQPSAGHNSLLVFKSGSAYLWQDTPGGSFRNYLRTVRMC